MGDPASSFTGLGQTRGLFAELLGLSSSVGRHLQALSGLAGLEAKEAGAYYLRAIIAIVVALVLLLFGYVLAVLCVAFLIAMFFAVSWAWITLGLAVLHFLGAGIAVFYALGRFKQPVFASTSAELKKDFASLKNYQG